MLTNLMFYFTKLNGIRRVGDGDAQLPRHMRDCQSMISLTSDLRTGTLYIDNLSAFSYLVLLETCRGAPDSRCACKRPLERLSTKLR